jgi:hypothetical protein
MPQEKQTEDVKLEVLQRRLRAFDPTPNNTRQGNVIELDADDEKALDEAWAEAAKELDKNLKRAGIAGVNDGEEN